jgi:hypothetical protein
MADIAPSFLIEGTPMLFAILLMASRPEFCWYSDSWRGSGYYNCKLGPWVKEYDQQQVPRRRDYKHERERDKASSLMGRAGSR